MSLNNIWWWAGVALVVWALFKFGRFFIKAIVVVLIILAAVFIAPKAFAATTPPWVTCGSTITWGVQPSPGTPETAKAVIGAAFGDVAAVTDLTVMVQSDGNPGTATTVMAWDDPGSGVVYPDGSIGNDLNSTTNVTARVHYLSATGPSSGPALKTLVYIAIGQDLGVPLTATGGHLTPADKTALRAACKAQAAAPVASPSPTPGATAATTTPDVPTQAVDTPATQVTVSGREKLIGYSGASAVAVVLALTLFAGRIRTLAGKRGIKVPQWSSIRDRVQQLWKRLPGFRNPFARDSK